jgi:hypothetical protein
VYRSYAISSSKSKWIIFITHLKEIIINSRFTRFNFNNFKIADPNNLPLISTNSKDLISAMVITKFIVKEIIFMALNQRKVIENSSNKVTQPKHRPKNFNVLPIAGKK